MEDIVNKIIQDNPDLQFPPKPTYGGKYCCVVGCSNNQIKDIPQGIRFHRFPRKESRRQEWIRAVKRVDKDNKLWQPGPNDVVCSVHFYGGKKSDVVGSPSYIPSIFPTHHTQPKTKAHEDRFKRLQKFQDRRNNSNKTNKGTTCHTSSATKVASSTTVSGTSGDFADSESETMATSTVGISTGQSTSLCTTDLATSIGSCTTAGETSASSSHMIQDQMSELKICIDYTTQTKVERMQCLKSEKWAERDSFVFLCDTVSKNDKATQFNSSMGKQLRQKNIHTQTTVQDSKVLPIWTFDDRQFKAFCGIEKNVAQFLLLEMGEKLPEGKLLSRESKLSLVLVKMKLNCSFSAISGFFGISDVLARRLFFDILTILYNSVKNYLIWFDKPTIKARMPKSFKALYPDTRVIIDCSEIECETPSKLSQKVLLWSNYKSRYTAKFLVGIAPSGEVTFVSKGFGGRATDAQITVASGLLDLIEEGDVVMSDKGFPQIQTKVSEAGGILVMPPFRRGERQFTVQENKDGYHCASVRIHVERCIRRLKIFHILKFLPIKMLPHFNKILVIICFLNNCMNDLIKDDNAE